MRSTTVLPGVPSPPPGAGDVALHRLEVARPDAPPFAAGSFEEVGPLSRWTGRTGTRSTSWCTSPPVRVPTSSTSPGGRCVLRS